MKRLLIAFAILGLVSLNINAQDSNDELLKKLVEKNILTKEEANELRQEKPDEKQSLSQTVKKVREAFNTPYMRFGGYGLFWYQYKEYEKYHHDMGPRVIFLTMSGNLTDHFRYHILGELCDPRIYEFYGEWMPAKAFNFRGGQFKVPFTFENMMSLTEIETISNTRSISSLTGMNGDPLQYSSSNWFNRTGRDIGIQASGSLINKSSHHLIHYAMGVFQGTGINIKENNNTKDFAGTLTFQPLKELRIAGGLYAGKASTYSQSGEFWGDHGRNRWSISADYKSDRIYARTEWINANDGGIKKEGLHGTALYYILPKKLNLAGKIDYFNQNKDTNSEVIDYIAAVNYYFYGQCRFQLNYTYSDFSKNWGNQHSSENLVQLQMQIVF